MSRTSDDPDHAHDETLLAGFAINTDPAMGAVVPPAYLSTSYSLMGFGEKRTFDYGRTANPNRAQLGELLAALERGVAAVVTASGMAAIDLLLTLVPAGGHVVAPHDAYGGTWRLLRALEARGALKLSLIDQGDAAALDAVFAAGPVDLLWVETPSNPLMRVVDIAALCDRAHAAGAKVAVDNTFLSPLLQKPLTLGADYVVHSTTKYLNGHSDVIGGVVVAADAADGEQLAWWANCRGMVAGALDSWLTMRGLRTLAIRIERQQRTAQAVARFLDGHAAVTAVHYPGLPDHPQHALAARQQRGFGAMLSFELGASGPANAAFVNGIERFTLAQSLGGVESLIAHPATMTHASMTPEARATAGLSDRLFRLSIGLDHEDDLIAALDQALGQTA